MSLPPCSKDNYADHLLILVSRQEFACFSYDSEHKYHLGDSSLKWYYNPEIGVDLSAGYESFVKHDDSVDEHLDSLLETIASHERETGKPIDAHIVTWRGMLTKVSMVNLTFKANLLLSCTANPENL